MTQKRSSLLTIENWEIPLDPVLPIWAHRGHQHGDRPITRLHVHSCLEVGCCHEGHGLFMIGHKVRTFSTGDVTIIAAGDPHFARSAPGTNSLWSWIYLDPMRLIPPGMVDPVWLDTAAMRGSAFANVFSAGEHPALTATAFRLDEELAEIRPGGEVTVRALVLELLVRAHRLKKVGRKTNHTLPDYGRLAPALQRLARDFAQPLRMGELARSCGLSEPQFRRVFLQTMGQSPLHYLNDIRVRTATALLRSTNKSVLEVSLESGFESVSSLHRAFRTRMKTTPRAWRLRP